MKQEPGVRILHGAGLRAIALVGVTASLGLLGLVASLWWPELPKPALKADPDNARQVALGREIYARRCASCHGKQLEGQPNWRARKADGRLPAPPHDESGHTWHHTDEELFEVTKFGREPMPPLNIESDMPAFGSVLTDEEIWAVLAFIKSSWPKGIRDRQPRITEESGDER